MAVRAMRCHALHDGDRTWRKMEAYISANKRNLMWMILNVVTAGSTRPLRSAETSAEADSGVLPSPLRIIQSTLIQPAIPKVFSFCRTCA